MSNNDNEMRSNTTFIVAHLLFTSWVLCAELAPTTKTGDAVLKHIEEMKTPGRINERQSFEYLTYVSRNKFGTTDHEAKVAEGLLLDHYNIPPF